MIIIIIASSSYSILLYFISHRYRCVKNIKPKESNINPIIEPYIIEG